MSLWKKHGTKVIGYVSAVAGIVEFIDMKTVNLIETSFPKYGPYVSHGILIASGVMTAYRGHKNSAAIAQIQQQLQPPQGTS